MAVETKQPGLNQTITGMGAATNGAAAGSPKRKRPSSLLAVANQLPSVENSLEEFIAKANQTLVDVGSWGTDKVKEQEDEKRKEIDALRWKAAETQLRESEVRESTLRRQLDNLQGKLAETEARAAVAAESGGYPVANDTVVSELRLKVARAEEKAASADMRARSLTDSLNEAKLAVGSRPSMELGETIGDDRVRHAEAKATKALAAARAIQAGLTVSSADLAAIESGLVVPDLAEPRKTPWLAIVGAFVVGVAIMFVVTKVVMKDAPATAPAPAAAIAPAAPAAAPAAVAPAPVAATPPAAVPSKPIVTPIEEPTSNDTAPTPTTAAPAPTPTPAPELTAPAAVAKVPAVHHAGAHAAPAHAAPTHAAPKAPATKKPAASNIADPFADAPAKKPAKAEKKPAAGAIADPF